MEKRFSFFAVDECHLISASHDYSVRIWDLKTNQQVGDPLLHDDGLFTVVLCSDGRGMPGVACVWKYDRGMVYARSRTEMRAFD